MKTIKTATSSDMALSKRALTCAAERTQCSGHGEGCNFVIGVQK